MRFIVFITALFLSLSCTQHKEPAKISIDVSQMMQKNNSGFAIQPFALILNVTSPEFEPIFVALDCHGTCSQISAEVPSDVSLRLQLIVVGNTTTSTTSKIFYGSVVDKLPAGEVSIPIAIHEIASFQQEAKWMGRYIPSSNHPLANKKLTGQLNILVKPQADHPAMKIQEAEIFGGWFHTFLLDTVNFKLRFKGWDEAGNYYDGIEVFNDLHDGNGINMGATSLSNGLEAIKIEAAPGKTLYRESNDGYGDEQLGPRIIGFFGSNPDAKTLCAKLANPASNVLFDGGTDPDQINRSRICETVSGNTCSTWANWSTDFNSSTALPFCSSPTAAQWPVDHRRIEDGIEFSGFYGPFHRNISAGQDTLFIKNTAPPGASWFINPDSISGAVEVFSRVNQGSFNEDIVRKGRGYDCAALESHGFASRAVIDRVSASYTFLPTELAATDIQFAFCPVAPDGNYFFSAAVDGNNNNNSPPPSQLEFSILDGVGNPISWSTTLQYEFPPVVDSGPATSTFVAVRNKHGQPVAIDDFSVKIADGTSGLGITLGSPASGPYMGMACNDPALTPPANITTLPHDGVCTFQLDFAPSAVPTIPATYHDDLLVGYNMVASGVRLYNQMKITAPVPYPVLDDSPNNLGLTNLNFDAPEGKTDVKFIKLEASAAAISYATLLLGGASPANFNLSFSGDPSCTTGASTLPTSMVCFIRIEYQPPTPAVDVSATIDFTTYNSNAGAGGTQSISLTGSSAFAWDATNLSVNGNDYRFDFGDISGPVNQDLTYQNTSSVATFDAAFSAGQSPFFFSNGFQWLDPAMSYSPGITTCAVLGTALSPLNNCTTAIEANPMAAGALPSASESIWIYYNVNGTFRQSPEITIDYQ